MRIAVVFPIVPFVYGGGQKMAEDLVNALNRYGHKACLMDVASGGYQLRSLASCILSSSLLCFDDFDMVIPLMPYNIRHPNVVPWLIGQLKMACEFFDDLIGLRRFGSEGHILRDIIVDNDTKSLQDLSRVYTISPRVKELFESYNGISPQVLPLPLDDPDNFSCNAYGDFIVYYSRIHPQKRQHLAVEAMKFTQTPVKLVVAGSYNDSDYIAAMRSFIKDNDLSDKIEFLPERFSEEQKFTWLSDCLGGFYLGEDEDYWAVVTTELMLSKKPVIAPADTGATKYVIKDGITGLQPDGTPQAIAKAMDKLYRDKDSARKIGEAGYNLIQKTCPSWETVVRTLTGEVLC